MDATLIITFVIVQHRYKDMQLYGFDMRRVRCCRACNPFVYGFFGALLHGAGVACFFWGVNSGMLIFKIVGPLLNFPAFVCYMGLAAVMERRLVYFGPRRLLQKASLVFPHTGLSQHADMDADHTVWCGMLNAEQMEDDLGQVEAGVKPASTAIQAPVAPSTSPPLVRATGLGCVDRFLTPPCSVVQPGTVQNAFDAPPASSEAKLDNAEEAASATAIPVKTDDSAADSGAQLRNQYKPAAVNVDQPLSVMERRGRLEGPYPVSCFLCSLFVGFCISSAINLAYFFAN